MNRSRDKGTRAATAVARYLSTTHPGTERRSLHGAADRGDITGIPGVVIEVKSAARLDFPHWLAQLDREMDADDAPVGLVWAKLPGTMDPARWAAVFPPHLATDHWALDELPRSFQRGHTLAHCDQLAAPLAGQPVHAYRMRLRATSDAEQPVLTTGAHARHLLATLAPAYALPSAS